MGIGRFRNLNKAYALFIIAVGTGTAAFAQMQGSQFYNVTAAVPSQTQTMTALHQQLQLMIQNQNAAEAQWRNHHGLLVGRAATENERSSAQLAERTAHREQRLAEFQREAAQGRALIAQIQATLAALPANTATTPPALTGLIDRANLSLQRQNRTWQDYNSSFDTAYAAIGSTFGSARDAIDFIRRGVQHLREDAPAPDSGVARRPSLFRRDAPGTPAPHRVVAQPTDSHGQLLYPNRRRLEPDAEGSLIAAASNDMQTWYASLQQNRMRGREGNAALPPLYVPRYVEYLAESQFIRTRGMTASQRDEALRLYSTRLDFYRTVAESTQDPMLRIRRVLSYVVGDFLRPYRRAERGMITALRGEGVNCEGRANLLYGVMSALHLELPTGWNLGVQMFRRHMELVLHNPHAHPPVIQLFSQRAAELTGPVYHPAVLLQNLIRTRNEAAPEFVANEQLLMAAASPAYARAGRGQAPPHPHDNLGNSLPEVPGADFVDGDIPEFAMNDVPNPEASLQTAAPVSARPLRPADLQRPPSAQNRLLTSDDDHGFCQRMAMEIMARELEPGDPQIQMIYSDYRSRALYHLPQIALVAANPNLLLQDSRLLNFYIAVHTSDDCESMLDLPHHTRDRDIFKRHATALAQQGRWAEVGTYSWIAHLEPSDEASRLVCRLSPDNIEIVPSSHDSISVLNPGSTNETQNSPTLLRGRRFHVSEIIPNAQDSREYRQQPLDSTRPQRIRLTDLEAISLLTVPCPLRPNRAYRNPAWAAILAAACRQTIPGPAALSLEHFPLYTYATEQLDAHIDQIMQCRTGNLIALAAGFRARLPHRNHCDNFVDPYDSAERNSRRVRAFNRLFTFLNSGPTHPNIPLVTTADCPLTGSPNPSGSSPPAPGSATSAH